VTTPNVAAQNNIFTGATTYGAVERIVRHNTDDPFSAAVDFRNAQSAAGTPVPAPAVIDSSYLFVAKTDTDGLSAVQKSLVRAIQFQIDSPVTLGAGAVTINRTGATSYGWYTGALPTGAVPTSVTSTISGATGLTTVTVTFTTSGFTEANSAAPVTINNGLGTAAPFTVNSSSLIDGRYNSTINGALVSLQFGGNITAQTPAPKNFLRFYGDLDGDGVLSNTEAITDFREARDNPSPFDPFKPFFDINNDGAVTNALEGAQINNRLAFGGFLP
jgi:hypothetical protein